jgi:hypothetical protein
MTTKPYKKHILLDADNPCSGGTESQKMFNLLARKLFFNLRCRVDSVNVVKKTLKVLNETVIGGTVLCLPNCFSEIISSGQQMLECDIVKEVLKDCQNSSISFLNVLRYLQYISVILPISVTFCYSYSKLRTSYFSSITNLVLLDSNDNFLTFLDQFSLKFEQLISCAAIGENAFATRENRQLLITLARDFRGITSATVAGSYAILFSWLVNNPKVRGASRVGYPQIFLWPCFLLIKKYTFFIV